MGRYNKITYFTYYTFSAYFAFFAYYIHNIIFSSERDGDQLVDFYWIDPLLSAERIVGRTKYAKKLYLQFEREESWDKPGVRAFGRVNGGLAFEAAYIIDRGSVPLLSVFYSDKSFLKGMPFHPIYRKCKQIII